MICEFTMKITAHENTNHGDDGMSTAGICALSPELLLLQLKKLLKMQTK